MKKIIITLILGIFLLSLVTATAGTGGTITYYDDSGTNMTVHTFTSDGTFTVTESGDVSVLVVAGGGGGGDRHGGGGGAGGLLYDATHTVTAQGYTITVGAGGIGGDYEGRSDTPDGGGLPGGNSIFSTMTSIGGGGGATYAGYPAVGGSGGGGAGVQSTAGIAGTAGQGNAGGNGHASYTNGGGGGGAGAVGQAVTVSTLGGNGGNGLAYNISGTSTYYAGGGGGGSESGATGGTGGSGGGGHGGDDGVSTNQEAGTANTGGGGGGTRSLTTSSGSDGGSGIVIISYEVVDSTVYCTFSGYVKDEDGTALVGANVTIWNQYNVLEYYENTTIAGGHWSLDIVNSTNIYMAGTYYNNTLIGQLKQGISGTC